MLRVSESFRVSVIVFREFLSFQGVFENAEYQMT